MKTVTVVKYLQLQYSDPYVWASHLDYAVDVLTESVRGY